MSVAAKRRTTGLCETCKGIGCSECEETGCQYARTHHVRPTRLAALEKLWRSIKAADASGIGYSPETAEACKALREMEKE